MLSQSCYPGVLTQKKVFCQLSRNRKNSCLWKQKDGDALHAVSLAVLASIGWIHEQEDAPFSSEIEPMSSTHTVTTVKLERKGFIGLTLPDHGPSLEEVRTGAKVRTSPQQPRQDKTRQPVWWLSGWTLAGQAWRHELSSWIPNFKSLMWWRCLYPSTPAWDRRWKGESPKSPRATWPGVCSYAAQKQEMPCTHTQ